jgi:hypothetical protein
MNSTSADRSDACIEICNSLLRGELSAVETYTLVIDKFPGHPAQPELHRMRSEHVKSSSLLSAHVRGLGAEPSHDSGMWGLFAKAVQSTADFFGADSAVESLHRGEKKGLADYHHALSHEGLSDEVKGLICRELVPPVKRNISTLERLEDSL